MTDTRRQQARWILWAGVLAGGAYLVVTVLFRPEQIGIAADVYYHAARAALSGGDIYAVTPPAHPRYRYLYPPAVVTLFVPYALSGSEMGALGVATGLSIAAGVGTVRVIERGLRRRGVGLELADRVAIAAFVLGSIHSLPSLVMGQVNILLGFGLALGVEAVDRERERIAGGLVAAVSAVKLFPAVVGMWFLRRGAWRAVVTAVATGVAVLLGGVAAFGIPTTETYLLTVLPGEFQRAAFAGTPDPARNFTTARRQVAALLPWASPGLLSPITAALLIPLVAGLYRRFDTELQRLAALLGTLIATLLFLPLEPLYFPILVYPLVLLLYLLPAGRARWVLSAGILGTYVTVALADVRLAIAVLPFPGGIEAALLGAVRATFTVIQPATVGMWLVLAGCLLVHLRAERRRDTAADDRTNDPSPP